MQTTAASHNLLFIANKKNVHYYSIESFLMKFLIDVTCVMSAEKFSGVSDCDPSHLAESGFGCTSIMRPSAPAATNALAKGVTMYHLPVP